MLAFPGYTLLATAAVIADLVTPDLPLAEEYGTPDALRLPSASLHFSFLLLQLHPLVAVQLCVSVTFLQEGNGVGGGGAAQHTSPS